MQVVTEIHRTKKYFRIFKLRQSNSNQSLLIAVLITPSPKSQKQISNFGQEKVCPFFYAFYLIRHFLLAAKTF